MVAIGFGFLTSYQAAPDSKQSGKGYILEHEKDIRTQQPSPHGAAGITTAYPFFAKADGLKVAFRKRTLLKGSSIGYHLQEKDEIYYIIAGNGIMKMNGETFPVTAGDAILTRPGNWHGLEPAGNDSVSLIINYINDDKPITNPK
jgi:mannose-6-phosphate isomerase-like protein (cupin superfamily)